MTNKIFLLVTYFMIGMLFEGKAQCNTDIFTKDPLCIESVVVFEQEGCPEAYYWKVIPIMGAFPMIAGTDKDPFVVVELGPTSGTFSVQLDTNGKLALIDTFTVVDFPKMIGTNTDDICSGDSHTDFVLNSLPGAGVTYAWTASWSNINESVPSGSGSIIPGINLSLTPGSSVGSVTYTVFPTLAGCAGEPGKYEVQVAPVPEINEIVTNCSGSTLDDVTVKASTSGGGTLEYNIDGGPYTVNNVFTGLSFGTYKFGVRISTGEMCEVVQVEEISCGCPTVSNNIISGGESICFGDTPPQITGMSASVSSGVFGYQWEISDSGANSWSSIASAVGQNYTPPTPAVSSDYRRLVIIPDCPNDVSNTVTIVVHSIPTAPVAGPGVVSCEGNTPNPPVSASVGAGNHIDWYSAPTGGILLFTNSSSYVSPETNEGIYTYYAEAVNSSILCTSSTRTAVTLEINARPSVPIGGMNQTNCEGNIPNPPVTAVVNAGETVDWYSSPISGVLLNTGPSYISSETAPGTYHYYAEARNISSGCLSETRTVVSLTINALPNNTVNGSDQEICQGVTPNPALTTSANTGEEVDWYLGSSGGTPIFTGNSFVSSESSVGTHTYYTEARNITTSCVSATRQAITLTILQIPATPVSGGNEENCEGIVPNPTLNATVGAGEVVDWYLSPSGGAAIFTGSDFISTETSVGSYSYFAESRNTTTSCVSAARTEVVLTINETPDFAGLMVNCDGAAVEAVEVTFLIGSGTLEYRVDNGAWQPSNVFLGLAIGLHSFDAREISTNCLTSSGSQQISCSCPTVANNTITESQFICEGENAAVLIGEEANAAGENFTYLWQSKTYGSTIWIDAGTERDYSPGALAESTEFRRLVLVTNCPDHISNVVSIVIKPDPIIVNTQLEEFVCTQNFSSGFQISSSPAGATYEWTSIAINVSGNSLSGSGDILSEQLFLIDTEIPGQVVYTVTPTLDQCVGPEQDFIVYVATSPEFSINSGTGDVICSGEVTTLSPVGLPSGNYDFQWQLPGGGVEISETIEVSITDPSENNYTLIVTEKTHPFCSFAQTFVFSLSDFDPKLIFSPNKNEICEGEEISFVASGGNKFEWSGFGTPTDLTTSFFTVTPPVGENEYSVEIENSNGCLALIEETIVVNAKPTPNIITNTDGIEFCENETITLSTELPYIEYEWSTSSEESMVSFVANPAITNFGVTVIDDKGCTNSDDIELVIHSAATASICNFISGGECHLLVVSSGLEVTFTAQDIVTDAACGDIKEYQWVFKKDGNTVRTETVSTPDLAITFTTEEEGINSIELVILDGCDCLSLPVVNTEFKVKSNEKCGASISTKGKGCLGTKYDLKAFPDSGTGTFNDPVEGYFIVEGQNIIEGITPIGSPITPVGGRDFIIHSIEQNFESGAEHMFNDVVTIEYLEEGSYDIEYYYNFSVCIEYSSKIVSIVDLPRFSDVVADVEACYGEEIVNFLFVPQDSDVNWELTYTNAGEPFTKVLNDALGYSLDIPIIGDNNVDIVLQTLTDITSSCENVDFEQKEFTIEKLDSISTSYTSMCNASNDTISYTLTITGGTGNYAVDGTSISGSQFVAGGYKPEEPQVLFIEDLGCDEEYIVPVNNIIGSCEFCVPLDAFISKLQVSTPNYIDICENEQEIFRFDFDGSLLSDKNGDGKIEFRDTLLANQTILYVIKSTPSNEYEPEDVLVHYKPVNQQFADISHFDLVFKDALDSVLLAGEDYYLTAFIVPNSNSIIAPQGDCKGIKSIPLRFHVAPMTLIDLSLENDDVNICNQEIDYQIWRYNSAQNDIWSSSDTSNVFMETDPANNRVLINFGTIMTSNVDIYLAQNNEYSTMNGILACRDNDTMTLELVQGKIAPAEDSIIWFPGNFLTYTDPGKCYEWGYIDVNGLEVTTSETTRFYIYEGTTAFENKTFFVDVWECSTDMERECVTRVFYNASSPPGLNDKSDANYDVDLYPNPHQGEFVLRLVGEQTGVFQSKVYDATGILIHESEFTKVNSEHEEIYSFENLPFGLYLIQVIDEGGLTNLIKMIKH